MLSVIMPVYNEKNTLEEIIKRVKAVDIDKEIIIVDDFSTDGTREILQKMSEPGIKVILQSKNQGKGAAIREGVKHATHEYVIIQDADLEYDPDNYKDLLGPILNKEADVVYGSRFLNKTDFSNFFHKYGNQFLTFLTAIIYGVAITDMETCYKLMPTKFIKNLDLKANRFDFEPEITAKIIKKGLKIKEVPISYVGRKFAEGKKITFLDGIAAVLSLLKYRFWD